MINFSTHSSKAGGVNDTYNVYKRRDFTAGISYTDTSFGCGKKVFVASCVKGETCLTLIEVKL